MSDPATTILPYLQLASSLSEHDAAALRELSDASQVRTWARRTVARYRKYIPVLLAIQNSVAPINKLPTEVLQKVFVFAPPTRRVNHLSWMLSLQLVCRQWRSFLLATPEYWAQGVPYVLNLYRTDFIVEPDPRRSKRLLNLFLKRSAPHPLELVMEYMPDYECPGREVLDGHFDRVRAFAVAEPFSDLDDVLYIATTQMKRLERLELGHQGFSETSWSVGDLEQWEAQNLPRLGRLSIPNGLFCPATTVPSLHTIILTGTEDIESLADIVVALERCPALTALCLHFKPVWGSRDYGRIQAQVVDLPNIRQLDITASSSYTYCFLSSITSGPPVIYIDLNVTNAGDDPLVLQSTIPRHHTGLYTPPNLDRMCLYSSPEQLESDWTSEFVSMRGYVKGEERVQVNPALVLRRADHLLQFLNSFGTCTLTELALDLRHLPSDVDFAFWVSFFAALPDLRSLELLSSTMESRAMKRAIAEHYLAASRNLGRQEQEGSSLSWVLRAETDDAQQLEEELRDVEQVLSGHADAGGRLGRLGLYITTSDPDFDDPPPVSATQVPTDGAASQLVTRAYVSRLEVAAEVVVVGGGWGFGPEDDEHNSDGDSDENAEDACANTGGEEKEADSPSRSVSA